MASALSLRPQSRVDIGLLEDGRAARKRRGTLFPKILVAGCKDPMEGDASSVYAAEGSVLLGEATTAPSFHLFCGPGKKWFRAPGCTTWTRMAFY